MKLHMELFSDGGCNSVQGGGSTSEKNYILGGWDTVQSFWRPITEPTFKKSVPFYDTSVPFYDKVFHFMTFSPNFVIATRTTSFMFKSFFCIVFIHNGYFLKIDPIADCFLMFLRSKSHEQWWTLKLELKVFHFMIFTLC